MICHRKIHLGRLGYGLIMNWHPWRSYSHDVSPGPSHISLLAAVGGLSNNCLQDHELAYYDAFITPGATL